MTVWSLARWTRSRKLVLTLAFASGLGIAIALNPDNSSDSAAVMVSDAMAAEFVRVQAPAESNAAKSEEKASKAEESVPGVDAEISIGEKGVTIRRNRGERRRESISNDPDFDSFQEFIEKAPWLAGLVFGVTAMVFLVPLIVIVLIIWYKLRSNRLRNETMLKLAERGVVPTAAAIDAVAAAPAATAIENTPATAPLYEQAKQIRRRAAWSDLRKGVILGGIGLGLTLYSMVNHGNANVFGLVLLFVGIGYGVLWYFEDRQIVTSRASTPPDARGGA